MNSIVILSRFNPAIAKNVATLNNDVAEVDAYAQLKEWPSTGIFLACGHRSLDFDGASYRIDNAGELNQRAIAHQLDDASAMLAETGIDEFCAEGIERRDRRLLVGPDQGWLTTTGYLEAIAENFERKMT